MFNLLILFYHWIFITASLFASQKTACVLVFIGRYYQRDGTVKILAKREKRKTLILMWIELTPTDLQIDKYSMKIFRVLLLLFVAKN